MAKYSVACCGDKSIRGFCFIAAEQISKEFSKSDSRLKPVNIALIIFLRSDIYAWVIPHATEPDKLNDTILQWTDTELLLRVIEKRFVIASENVEYPEEVWREFFCETVNNIPTRDYIIASVMPKPRDIIYLCKYALMYAKNRGADIIEESDIYKAENDYSKHVWDTIIVEMQADVPEIEDVLTEFAGENEIVLIDEIKEIFDKLSISTSNMENVINKLIIANFLGLETDENTFSFLYDIDLNREKILHKLAEKTALKIGLRRFKINKPFHTFLEINSEYKPSM